ncbi:MAG TPA: hypothetical protein P5280_13860, partial [Cyclobacteriaceae bacterium]|nr:hypothetical protein [Cyclobacteriaceae bacterium]
LLCLAWLAEAEQENNSNSATNVFCECFAPLHPQLPLSLYERQQLLANCLDKNQPTGRRLLAVKAIEQTLSRQTLVTLRRSSSAKPLDSSPSLTYGQVWDYIETLVQLLMAIIESETSKVSDYTWSVLPRIVAEATIQALPNVGTRHFETLVERALTNRAPISISRLAGALDQSIVTLNSRLGKHGEENDEILQENIGRLQILADQLYQGSFAIRLQIWVEDWVYVSRENEIDKNGRRIYRGNQEIQNLAKEAIDNPPILTSELFGWLCSSEAKKAREFFFELGKLDFEKHWIEEVERLAKTGQGGVAIPGYYGGLSKVDPVFISNRLDTLVDEGLISPEIIIQSTRYFQGNLAGVNRAEKLITEKRIDPINVVRTLGMGGWISTLSDDEFLQLLKAIAGTEIRYAMAIVDLFGMWLHHEREIEGELSEIAWKCLNIVQLQDPGDIYDCKELASYLTKQNKEQGFQLFEKLLTDRNFWNPIERYGNTENKFWRSLVELDQERAYKIILNFALREFRGYPVWSSDVHELINSDVASDFLVNYACENEAQAIIVADSINSKRQDYWNISLRIVEKYPTNLQLQKRLKRGLTREGWEFLECPHYRHFEKCRKEVERVLHDPATPPQAHPWLQQLASELDGEINRERISEEDELINSWRHPQYRQTSSFEKTWAIGTLQKLGREDLVEKLERQSIQ